MHGNGSDQKEKGKASKLLPKCQPYIQVDDDYVNKHHDKGLVYNCWDRNVEVGSVEIKNLISVAEIEVFCYEE